MCWGTEEIPHLQHTGWWAGLTASIMNAHVHHIQDCSLEENNINFRDEQCKLYGDKWRALDEGTRVYIYMVGSLRVFVCRHSA